MSESTSFDGHPKLFPDGGMHTEEQEASPEHLSSTGDRSLDDDTRPTSQLPYQDAAKRLYRKDLTQVFVALLILGNFIVTAASAEMALEMDKDDKDGERLVDTFDLWEWFFIIVFTIELIFNMYAHYWGEFWTGPDWSWNQFDFLIVVISWVALGLKSTFDVKVFRTLRAFRVFRLFKRVESLRLIIEGVTSALPGVANAFGVLFIFMGIWAVMGVEFFRPDVEDGATLSLVDQYVDQCWGTFPRAFFTMIQILTFEGWNEEVNKVLVHEKGYWGGALFSCFFGFFGGLVLMNVVVAILLEKYLLCVQKQSARKRWKAAMSEIGPEARLMQRINSVKMINCFRLPYQDRARKLYEMEYFEISVAVLIFLAFLVTAIRYTIVPKDDSGEDYVFYVLEVVFTVLFAFELGVNMYGHWGLPGAKAFWTGDFWAWNVFDFIVVTTSSALFMSSLPGVSVLRLFRAFRVVRLFKRVPSLRVIVESVVKSLPKVFQAFCITVIMQGVWSIIAVQYFRHNARDEWGSFFRSMLSLWQIMTGDSWASGKNMARDWIFDYDRPVASLFFVSYVFVVGVIMNNLVITILLEVYLQTTKKQQREKEQQEIEERHRRESFDDISKDIDAGTSLDQSDQADISLVMIIKALRDGLGTETAHLNMPMDDVMSIMDVLCRSKPMKPVLKEMYLTMGEEGDLTPVLMKTLNIEGKVQTNPKKNGTEVPCEVMAKRLQQFKDLKKALKMIPSSDERTDEQNIEFKKLKK